MSAPAVAAYYPSLFAKRVLITGGASGIGAAMVDAFVGQGAAVAFVDRDAEAGAALSEAMAAHEGPAPVRFAALDVTDTPALQAEIDRAAAAMGGLDILINNVASDARHATAATGAEAWRANLSVNLDPTFFATQAALAHFPAAGGSIVNVSSLNAFLGPPDMPAYAAAKAAILGLTKAHAREFGARDIRVNAIVPGWVDTPAQRARGWLTPEAEARWLELCCLKRLIDPKDVARLAVFLASDDARMITGQAFVIDAGRT